MTWYQQQVREVLRELDVDDQGLSHSEARKRLQHYGPNRIQKGEEISAWKVLLHQFTSPLIYVLLGALAVTLAIQSWADAIVIGAVLVINATVGFIQQYQAESAVQSLMRMIRSLTSTSRSPLRSLGQETTSSTSSLIQLMRLRYLSPETSSPRL